MRPLGSRLFYVKDKIQRMSVWDYQVLIFIFYGVVFRVFILKLPAFAEIILKTTLFSARGLCLPFITVLYRKA